MDRLNLISVALGLAALAGVNLYLTVFATGLAIHFHWIMLAPPYQSLEVLANPWIIGISATLYVLEFFADKIPWVDSIWDAVHTIIRPIGGALLAIQVLGHPSPTMSVLVALLAGGTSLVSHTAKAATRLASNTSPEPFSNIALSVTEDAVVLGGLAFIYRNPIIAFAIFVVAIFCFFYFAPKILRATKLKIWLAWKKLNSPAAGDLGAKLPDELPPSLAAEFARQNIRGETIAWAVPCISARGRRIPSNIAGALIAVNEDPRKLLFLERRRGRRLAQTVDLRGATVTHEPKFLSENLTIIPAAAKNPKKYIFIFPRSEAALVSKVVDDLRVRVSTPIWPVHDKTLEEVATAT
ncbi:MAG TPA: DUF4126 domain-containing protein [Chthoniobacterales bacterium]